MSFQGELREFRLFDVLQMIATTGKSGRLSLTRRRRRGLVIFRHGKIVFAAADSVRETLGSLMLSQGLVTDEQLGQALEVHRQRPAEVRLGEVLVQRGWVTEEALEEAVTHQVERVVAELGSWSRGFFDFTPMAVPERGEVAVDARDFLLREGVSADHVLLKIAVQLDHAEKVSEAEAPVPGALSAEQLFALKASQAADAEPAEDGQEAARAQIAALRQLVAEIRSPRLTGEVTQRILESAGRDLKRCALFAVHAESLSGIAQRGVDGLSETAVRELRVPLDFPSILRVAVERRSLVRGPLGTGSGDELLFQCLGGGAPEESLAVPLVVGDKVELVLYGDQLPDRAPIGPVYELELLLLQTALAMERAMLKERVEQLEVLEVLRRQG